jgi:membrane protease YdiL (CAAX protease family)
MSGFAALLVIAWVAYTRKPWSTIGFVRPRSWARTIALGVLAGIALKFVMKAVVLPLLGADPRNAAYQHLVGNPAALPGILFTVIVIAGFGEEIFWRGFLFDRFAKLFGIKRAGASTIVVTSMLFALAHLADQGGYGATQALFTGLAFGTAYRRAGNLWLPIAMHVAFDITAVLIIYADLEMAVATLLFP